MKAKTQSLGRRVDIQGATRVSQGDAAGGGGAAVWDIDPCRKVRVQLLDRRSHADSGDVLTAIHGRHSATAQDALEFVLAYLLTQIRISLAVVATATGQVRQDSKKLASSP